MLYGSIRIAQCGSERLDHEMFGRHGMSVCQPEGVVFIVHPKGQVKSTQIFS